MGKVIISFNVIQFSILLRCKLSIIICVCSIYVTVFARLQQRMPEYMYNEGVFNMLRLNKDTEYAVGVILSHLVEHRKKLYFVIAVILKYIAPYIAVLCANKCSYSLSNNSIELNSVLIQQVIIFST